MQNIDSITFFFPSRDVGGAEYLFLRLANHIAENSDIKVFYIDYEDGFAGKNLSGKVFHIPYKKGKKPNIFYKTTLVTSYAFFFNMYDQLNIAEDVKLFFCSLHPHDIINSSFPFCVKLGRQTKPGMKWALNLLYKKEAEIKRKTLNMLYENNSLAFMDLNDFETNRHIFDLEVANKKYLPIPVSNANYSAKKELADDKAINIGWLGRLVDFKIFSLLSVIENADIYSRKYNQKIRIHIIGSGDKEAILKNLKFSGQVELIFTGILTEDKLNQYLINNTDILFAMGTACIEGAKLRIPSVIVDYSLARFNPDYKYNWFYELEEYSLGGNLEDLQAPNNHTFEDILGEIYKNFNKESIAERCFSHYKANHSIEATSGKFLGYLSGIGTTMSDLVATNIFKSKLYNIYKLRKLLN